MKKYFKLFYIGFLLVNFHSRSQNIIVNSDNLSGQELVENILFGTNCVENIAVTNLVSGNFSNNELSYGYFNANNSNFPFSEGLVLTTGRLSNVPGPNDDLSDDDAPNWGGDQDLEDALGINNTLNATIIEFSFVPQANSINFRYLFASEEYRENEPTTCQFSDAFAFLIRPVGGQYENLALVPGTSTPVQVTTVRPEIPGACDALNEEYFEQFNGLVSPINFNGQTTVLTAETDLVAGQIYEIKLVIADETNYRYDSAVFIEANSFNIGVDLGDNLVLCDGETTTLQVDNDEANEIRWYYDGQLINTNDTSLSVTQTAFGSGLYAVEVDLPSGCTAEDEVQVFFDEIVLPDNLSVSACVDEDGFGVFNLFDVSSQIDPNLQVIDFYNSIEAAEMGVNPIPDPGSYNNVAEDEVIFAKVIGPGNCTAIATVTLIGVFSNFEELNFYSCSTVDASTNISFNVNDLMSGIAEESIFEIQDIELYFSEVDAVTFSNEITSDFIEIESANLPSTIYARIDVAGTNCDGIIPIILEKVEPPLFSNTQTDFLICENDEDLVLDASLVNSFDVISYEWNTGENTETISVNEAGNYSVVVTSFKIVENEELICTNIKNFNVLVSSEPTVSFIQTGFGIGGQLIISAEGSGEYEFALNNSGFQDSNVFDIFQIDNTITVNDKNGCGSVSLNFVAINIPDFFTPNGDGFNDYWQIEGVRQNENNISTIYIFDRYGKLIYENIPQQIGWDGTYKGKPMPQQDYWYKIILNSGRSVSGHFTLKR